MYVGFNQEKIQFVKSGVLFMFIMVIGLCRWSILRSFVCDHDVILFMLKKLFQVYYQEFSVI